MINTAYGKTMENLRKRINVRLVNNKKDFLKYTSRPTHITHKIFDENYAAIHEIKLVLMLNKPIYVGFTVLKLSKCRSIHPRVFLGKGVLKICSKLTGGHPCRSAISIKLLCNLIEITL